MEAGEAFGAGSGWWRSERRIRSAAARLAPGHVPDAEVHWPDLPGSPYPGECWAVEVELTPKAAARTAAILAGLLARRAGWEPDALPGPVSRYDHVVYLCSPAALAAVRRAAAALPAATAGRVEVRDLPRGALL